MRRTTIVAACSAALGLLLATVHPHPAAASHRAQARVVHHRAPLPRAVLHRLAVRARHLHHVHPQHSPHTFFLRLCKAWRHAHARPAPDAVVPAVTVAAHRYGFEPAGMLRVARCESNLDRRATNGQYLGLFQLGGFARARYLHGAWTDAYANAIAAARYARDSGGWGPWTCGYNY